MSAVNKVLHILQRGTADFVLLPKPIGKGRAAHGLQGMQSVESQASRYKRTKQSVHDKGAAIHGGKLRQSRP